MLFDSFQYWSEFVVMYKTLISHVNVMKKVQWEGIKLCAIFGGTRILFRQLEDSRVGGWCRVGKGGRPVA